MRYIKICSLLALLSTFFNTGYGIEVGQTDQAMQRMFRLHGENSENLELEISRFIIRSEVQASEINIFLQDTLIKGLENCERLDQAKALSRGVLISGVSLVLNSGHDVMVRLRTLMGDITRSTISWAVSNSVDPVSIVVAVGESAVDSYYKNESILSSREIDIAVIQGIYSGINYTSNRLYLPKNDLIVSMLQGMSRSIYRKGNQKDRAQQLVQSYVKVAIVGDDTAQLGQAGKILAEGILSGYMDLHDKTDAIPANADEKLTKISSSLLLDVLNHLKNENERIDLSYGIVSKVHGEIVVQDLVTGKKVPKAFIEKGLGVYEGSRISVPEGGFIAFKLENGQHIELLSDSVLEIRKLRNSTSPEDAIPQFWLDKGELLIRKGEKEGSLVLINKAGKYLFKGASARLLVGLNSQVWSLGCHVLEGSLEYLNNASKVFLVGAGQGLNQKSSSIVVQPEVYDLSRDEKTELMGFLTSEMVEIENELREKVVSNAKIVADYRYNKRLGLVTFSMTQGLAAALAKECSVRGIEVGIYKGLLKSIAKGSVMGGLTFSTQNGLDSKLIAELTAKGITKGTVLATEGSGYKGLQFREKSAGANKTSPFIDISRGNSLVSQRDQLTRSAEIADSKISVNSSQIDALKKAMVPESERLSQVINAVEPNNDTNTEYPSAIAQKLVILKQAIESQDLDRSKIACVALVDSVFNNVENTKDTFNIISKVLNEITSSQSVTADNFFVSLNVLTSSISEYYLARNASDSDLIEMMARLCNSISQGVTRNAGRLKISRTDMVRNISYSVSSPWMLSNKVNAEQKIKVVKGVNYGLPFPFLNMILASVPEDKQAEIIKSLSRQSAYGVISAAVLDDDNMVEVINAATDAFTSSLITVASKKKLSIDRLAILTGSASEGVMSGAIESLSNNELPVEKLGVVFLQEMTGDVRLERISSGARINPLELGAMPAIHQDYSIITGDESQVILMFSNGTTITLLERSRLDIDEFVQEGLPEGIELAELNKEPSVSTTRLNLAYGDMIFDVKKLNEKSLMIVDSPIGKTRIRGTSGRKVAVQNSDGSFTGGTELLTGQIDETPRGGGPTLSISPNQAVTYQVNAQGTSTRGGVPTAINENSKSIIGQVVESQNVTTSTMTGQAFSEGVRALKTQSKVEVSEKVANLSGQVASSVSSSGVGALAKFGYGSAVQEITAATSGGAALGAVRSSKEIGLDVENVAYEIARGSSLGAVDATGRDKAVSVVGLVSEGHNATLNLLKSSGVFDDNQIGNLDKALTEGRNSVLNNTGPRDRESGVSGSDESKPEQLINPGQTLTAVNEGRESTGGLSTGSSISIQPSSEVNAPQSLDSKMAESISEVLSEAQDFVPVTVAEEQAQIAAQAQSEGDPVTVAEDVMTLVSEGSIGGALEFVKDNPDAKINITETIKSVASGTASGGLLGFDTVGGTGVSGISKVVENIFEGGMSAVTENGDGLNFDSSTLLGTVAGGVAQGNINTANELGDSNLSVVVAITKDSITKAITESSSGPTAQLYDSDTVMLSLESETTQALQEVYVQNALDSGLSVNESMAVANQQTQQTIESSNNVTNVAANESGNESTSSAGSQADSDDSSSGDSDGVFDFLGSGTTTQTFDPPLTTITTLEPAPIVVTPPIVPTTEIQTPATPADVSPIR